MTEQELKACPNCPNVGWYVITDINGVPEQVQCQFCHAEPNSVFNAMLALQSELDTLRTNLKEAVEDIKQCSHNIINGVYDDEHIPQMLIQGIDNALDILRSHGLIGKE